MARGKKHIAEQVVNLLRQIEAGRREAEAYALRSGFARSCSRALLGKPLCFEGIFTFIGFYS
jgi:hypothetical protein